jgi:hypothetical protein
MRPRFTKKAIAFIATYITACAIVTYLWDFRFAIQRPMLSNMVVAIFAMTGGFLLAYWLIDSARIERETERKKRVLSTLKTFKNFLLPWLFNYACVLSGHFLLYDQNRIYTGKYQDDIPELEDIFGIAVWDKSGKRLRGTDAHESIGDEMLKRPLSPQSLYHTLNYGLRELGHIERRIKEFPSVVEEVDPDVAKIVHLSEYIRSRIAELQEWEKEHDKKGIYVIDDSIPNLAVRSNLRAVGRYAVDAVIAMDANIQKLKTELH